LRIETKSRAEGFALEGSTFKDGAKENVVLKKLGSVTHIYMEIAQGNSLYSYLYPKQTKMSCFSFYLFCSAKLENRRAEQILPRYRAGTSGRGEIAEKGSRRVNMVQKLYTHACKCNNDTWCSYCMNRGRRGIKGAMKKVNPSMI
jgi:hypothetical protein